jgi:hypothetical protein
MGLDMYLYARRTVDGEARPRLLQLLKGLKRYDDEHEIYLSRWDHSPAAEREQTDAVIALAGLAPLVGEESKHALVPYDGSHVDLTVVYWRKANAIHAWFVENCQDGVDECQDTPVHPEQLAALHSTCRAALTAYQGGDLTSAGEILTPRSGFFFGSTDVDEWWAQDVEYTAREIERIITAAARIGGVEFFYHSSW